MNKEKLTYLSPETETLVVRFEGFICSSPGDVQANGTTRGNVLDPGNYGFTGW